MLKHFFVLLLMNISHIFDWFRRLFSPKKPWQSDASMILANLYLSGFFEEWDRRFDCVVNVAEEDFDNVPWWAYGFLWAPRPDMSPAPSPKELQAFVSVICLWLDLGKRVLVHCDAGNNRSATVVIAYLMYSMHLTTDEAIAFARSKRPSVGPHAFQVAALREYEAWLSNSSVVGR